MNQMKPSLEPNTGKVGDQRLRPGGTFRSAYKGNRTRSQEGLKIDHLP